MLIRLLLHISVLFLFLSMRFPFFFRSRIGVSVPIRFHDEDLFHIRRIAQTDALALCKTVINFVFNLVD